MRAFNPGTGKPYPRRRLVNWPEIRSILRYRQEAKRLQSEGFVKVNAFTMLQWESPSFTHLIKEARIGHGGKTLWVKLEPARQYNAQRHADYHAGQGQ